MTPRSRNPPLFIFRIFSFMMDMFTQQWFHLIVSSKKGNQRPTKFLIITPRFVVWLRGGMHTEEHDSRVGCTLRSMTPGWDVHCGAWLRGGMHTAEHDSGVGCTLRSMTPGWDAHCRAWLRGSMHTAELNSNCNKLLVISLLPNKVHTTWIVGYFTEFWKGREMIL